LRQWKLSPMDLESFKRWDDYSRARDMMFEYTDRPHAPWYAVDSNNKKRARLNCIAHILSQIPYKATKQEQVKLPKRKSGDYDDKTGIAKAKFVEQRY